jgi:hypothetical protein
MHFGCNSGLGNIVNTLYHHSSGTLYQRGEATLEKQQASVARGIYISSSRSNKDFTFQESLAASNAAETLQY